MLISFPDKPVWALDKSGNQAITSATETKITWEAEEYASHGVQVDLTNNRIYTLHGGTYAFSLSIGILSISAVCNVAMRLFKNGSIHSTEVDDASHPSLRYNMGVTFIADAMPGDYWEFYIYPANQNLTLYSAQDAGTAEKSRFTGGLVSNG